MRRRRLTVIATLALSASALLPTAAHAAGVPGTPTNLATSPTPITAHGTGQACGTGLAYAGIENIGGVDGVYLSAQLNQGSDNAPSYSAVFDVTDETTGTVLAPIDSAGQAVPPATVQVSVPVVDGHAYSWTVTETDGTTSSSAAGPCDFVSDTSAPLSPTVVSTDFPSSGTNLESGEPGSFTLTSSDPTPAVGTSSGLKGFAYVFDGTLSVGAPVVAANADGSLTISGQSFNWGTHTLAVQAVDGAGNVSQVTQYLFYVPQNPDLYPVLKLTPQGALTVEADGTASTAFFGVENCSFDFGDGSPADSGSGCTAAHTYQKPGTYPVTLTISDGTNQKSLTESVTTTGSDFTAYHPTRILDTRHGTGAQQAKVGKGSFVKLRVAGTGSIPAGVTAVALNLTVTDTTGNGWVAAVADGAGAPSTSNLNYLAGQTVANAAIVRVPADGYIDVYNGGSGSGNADLIADVTGYFRPSAAAGYAPVTPARLLDTRHGTGAPANKIPAKAEVPVAIAGHDGIPATGVTAVAVHVTVTDTTGNGWIAAEPDGAATPTTSSLNYLKGQTISNTVIVPVAADGDIELYNGGGTTPVDLIADVTGYFSAGAPNAFVPTAATRVVDTRRQTGGALHADAASAYAIGPANEGIAAVVGNLTATESSANGFLTAYPDGITRPGISNLNYFAGQNLAGLAVLDTAIEGGQSATTNIYNTSTGTVQLIIDVFGYFEAS